MRLTKDGLTCIYCRKASTGDRPNPGESQPGYVWYYDNEDAPEKGLNDEQIPYGNYHISCHEVARAHMDPEDRRVNLETEAAKYATV